MVIAFDTSAQGSGSGATSINFNITIASNSDRILIVAAGDLGGDTVTGVTHNSVPLTFINKSTVASGDTVSLWYLVAPDTGTQNIVATRTSTTSTFKVNAVVYYGASQTGVPDSSNTNSGNGITTLTTSTTTIADNCWTVSGTLSSRVISAGAGVTIRENQNDNAIGDSNGAITPAGSDSHQYNLSNTSETATAMISIAPAVAVASTSGSLFLGGGL